MRHSTFIPHESDQLCSWLHRPDPRKVKQPGPAPSAKLNYNAKSILCLKFEDKVPESGLFVTQRTFLVGPIYPLKSFKRRFEAVSFNLRARLIGNEIA